MATNAGLAANLLVVLDRSDSRTIEVVERIAGPRARTLTIDEGDLGAARNAGAASADGTFVAFLDSDDLWGDKWLQLGVEAAVAASGAQLTVWHPEISFFFGDNDGLYHHVSSDDSTFDLDRFRMHNSWTALCLVERAVLLDLPYRRNRLDVGLGFEDWSWNEEVLRRGGVHRVVKDTCHFVSRERTRDTMMIASRGAHRMPWGQGA